MCVVCMVTLCSPQQQCVPQDLSLEFTYRSAVFRRTGSSPGQMGKCMLDFVFTVDDHGTPQTSSIQGKWIYIYVFINTCLQVIGYGVIDDLLIRHSSVRILLQKENGKLEKCRDRFVSQPSDSFSAEDLFLQRAGLSYSGECFLMLFGEEKSKFSNIVKDNMPHLYNSIVRECPRVKHKPQQGPGHKPGGSVHAAHGSLQQQITRLVERPGKNRDVEEILLQVAQDPTVAPACSKVKHAPELELI
uniref:Phosphatidate cytidylyltransferase, mitochondrial n=1 Tax=Cyprinus carpio TaxID=7962 RepID=A0A8C1PPD5_CYPCA